jgi:predicted peptidase
MAGGFFGFMPSAKPLGGKSGLLSREVQVGNSSYGYQLYAPARLRRVKNPPLILFLHGIGQRGEGGFIKGAAALLVRRYLERLPAIVLLPQCARGRYWSDPEMDGMVMATLKQTLAEFGADQGRLYLAGVSMGGYGVWHLAAEHQGTFAGLVSICGGSPLRSGERFTSIAKRIGQTPAWVFHGADDRVVPVSESRQMVAALKAAGGNVRYSEYEGVGHNVWLNAAAEPGLLTWLLEQRAG